jgi:hypothetical protein
MKILQSSIALACLLAGADAFGAMPDSTTGPSHACVLPDAGDAGADGVVMSADNTWCGRDGASHCEDFPDEVVGSIFGKGCADLFCDGSMVIAIDPNPTIAQLIKGWCPLKCDGCGVACEDKPWLLEANQASFGTPAVATCEAFSVPMPVPESVGAWNLNASEPCALTDGLPSCDDPAATGCCWWTDEAYMTNPSCEALFRAACPSMSGLCDSCPGGRRKLNAVADRATVGSLMTSGAMKTKGKFALTASGSK